ncbi:MAG: FtsW/RodA/SpoVE family cell cycle protein [Bacteroides sp.]|nr:MAG: FtsW/RodA/SpoVE family cell cycle protein [Bacteroides sp.]
MMKGDKYIWIISIFLYLFSILIILSTTTSLNICNINNPFSHVIKHSCTVILGIIIIYICHLINYKCYFYISNILILISIFLLLYTLFFGININQASRWIYLPILDLTFQTSDLSTLSLILFLSSEIYIHKIKQNNRILISLLIIIITCSLIAPYNLSTSLILFLNSVILFYISNIEHKYIFYLFILICILLSFIWVYSPRKSIYKSRITAFLQSNIVLDDNNYQINQAKIAIYTGGLFGKGPGKSLQRNHLPFSYNDFIYAIIIEEYGLILGAIFILFLYFIIMYRIIKIVIIGKEIFGVILITGLGINIIIQTLLSASVNIGIFPVTGVSFPFLSMGGTSVIFNSIKLGIILNISRYNKT